MTGGINRFVEEAKPTQFVEGQDVFADAGELRRRDSFKSELVGPYFTLPTGITTVKVYTYGGGGSYTTPTGRRLSVAYDTVGATKRILVGCEEQFDGIEFGMSPYGTAPTGHRWLRVRFVKSWTPTTITGHDSDFVDATSIIDTTVYATGDNAHSLIRNGVIAWHSSQIPTTWASVSIDSVTRYWVALDFSAIPPIPGLTQTTSAGLVSGTITLNRPGIKCFQMEKISGIIPLGNKSASRLLVMSERTNERGQDKGTQIAAYYGPTSRPTHLGVMRDNGSGVLGTKANLGANGAGSWNYSGGTRIFSKSDRSYDWIARNLTDSPYFYGQHGGFALMSNIQPDASPSPSTTTFSYTTSLIKNKQFENCIMVCTTTGGCTAGRRNRIAKVTVSGGVAAFTFQYAWDGTPTTGARFKILSPQASVVFGEFDNTGTVNERPRYEVSSNTADDLYFNSLQPDDSTLDDAIPAVSDHSEYNSPMTYSLEMESRYEIPKGRWCHTFDPITRSVIVSNGEYDALQYDGITLRKLNANSDPDDARVIGWLGLQSVLLSKDGQTNADVAAQLRNKVPVGKFITDYMGRLVVSGVKGDSNRVYWSAPGFYNDIWPRSYEAIVQDPDGNPITGINKLNEELLVFTSTGIYATQPPDQFGNMSFYPKSVGIGFASHHAVVRVPFEGRGVLIGANGDGVYAFMGGEVFPVLDDWKRVIPGGVTKEAMGNAVATTNLSESLVYIAVPSGGSLINDKIFVYDYARKTHWVWSAPFGGVSSMSTIRSQSGKEEVLFGHYDGFVSKLTKNKTDDGSTITGYALSKPTSLGTTTGKITGAMVSMLDTGGTDSVTIKFYVDEGNSARQTSSSQFDGGTAEVGSAVVDTDIVGGKKYKTRKINAKSGTRGESAQIEIRGTSRWQYKYGDVLMEPMSQRSKRRV